LTGSAIGARPWRDRTGPSRIGAWEVADGDPLLALCLALDTLARRAVVEAA
jgi:hypothetical protein